MMPGETHPAAPGTAADLVRCQGCASLQQNLNEYVEALITLKQKIINTDNLLTEYQKKCDELQFARRENSTLHHQVEQMLQKISPLQKCQEELGSLKAELEEKKSSLKLYQDTRQEYARVKEECLKSDAQKKKLEAKVKKLEEAAVRQTQDFKQLRNEKKILEKEFKKTQERLDEFSKQKNERGLRHIGTQISSDSYGSIDKRKVKLLLKELWLCVNSAHRLPGEGSMHVPEKPAKENIICGASREDGALPAAQGSLTRTSDVQACLTELSMEVEGNCASCESAEEDGPSEGGESSLQHVSHEESHSAVAEPRPDDGGDKANFSNCGRSMDEDLQAAINFFKLPPPLLSPVPSPPLVPPHLSSFSSPLVPETCFGEYTDSSDNETNPLGNSPESASEDDAAESQDYFGLLGKSKGGNPWVGKPKSKEADVDALRRFSVHRVTPGRTEPLAAAPREPSTISSLAQGRHWAASPSFVTERDNLDAAERQVQVRKPENSVQAESTLCRPARNLWVEMSSGNLAQENEVRAEETEPSSFPLVKRTLNELSGFEGNPLSSKTIGSPRPGFKKCSLIDGVVSELDQVSGAGCLQRSREREAVGGPMLGPPEPENSGPDDVMAAAGLDGKGGFSSSSTSVSVFSKPQSSWLKYVSNADMPTDTIPRELSHTEELQMKRLDAFLLQAEPPKPSIQEHNPGNSVRVLNSVLGAPALNDQQSRKVESTNILKGMTKMYSLPQSSFQKMTKDGQCESRDPVPEFTLRKSNLTTLTCSQAGSVMGGSAFVESTSWHHSDVLRRGGQECPRAPSEREQTGNCQSEQVVSALEGRGFSARLELLREGASCPPTFKATAALLPNQVSVITKQMRPEKAQHTSQEQWRPCGNEQTSATEDPGNNADDLSSVDKQARDIQEVALVKSPSPEVSTSWKIPDLDSPSGSLPAENFDYSTNSRLSFSSEDSLSQSQDTECESALQGEMQTPPQTPHTAKPDTRRVEAEELLPAEFTEPCGDTGHASTEAPVVPSDILSTPQHAGRAFPESHVTAGPSYSSTLSSTDEETEDAPQNSPPAASCCYTGIREQGEEDTEVDESEAFSCSEGEHEAEIPAESREHYAVGNSEKHVDNKAELAESRSSADVGYLTSALQHFNISTFPDLDRLSTSEVVMFLESCQLRDYSSGDSVSECSSKGTLSKESKQSVLLGGKCGKQLCEEETAGISEEWIEPEEGDDSKNPRQHVSCSLENLSKVLTKLGQELHEDCSSNDPDNLFLLNTHSSPAAEGVGAISPNETPTPHVLEVPQPSDGNDTGSSPTHAESDPKHSQRRPEEESDVTRCSINGGEGGLAKPGPLLAQSLDPEAPPRTEQSSICEADSAFQYQLSTVTSEVINVLLNKDQNVVIEKGDNWAIINGVAVSPDVEQVILCDTPGDGPISQDQGILDAGSVSVTSEEKPAEASQAGTPCPEPPCGSSLPGSQEDVSSCVQNTNFDKSRLRSRPVKPSIWVSSNIYEQTAEAESVAFDHTYCNWKSESVSKSKNRSKISNKDQSLKPGKTSGLSRDDALQSEVTQPSGARENTKPPRTQAQPVVANADTSTPTDCSPDTLSKIRQEVGPPLPPLLAPLIATPPRTSQPLSPLIASASPSPASLAGHISPLGEIPGPPGLSSWPEEAQQASPPGPSPSPSTTGTAGRIMSSPLQFCAATPKHALPVPGRLPPCAPGHATVGGTQENSVKILDTMYPELSARARTLNLLKGNLQLSRGSCVDGKVLIGFKAITSTSTAFVKTGSSSGGEGSQETLRDPGMQQGTSGKRTLSASMLRSAKRLRLDSESPEPESTSAAAGVHTNLPGAVALDEAITAEEVQGMDPEDTAVSPLPGMPKETVESHDEAIARALKKIAEAAFDLLPVIRSHVYVGNISKKPVMRDQEKEVVYEFSTAKKHLAECLLRSILSELKLQKTSSADHNYLHALCRVYVGICRQLGDLERARLFCYSLLKEDFPESEKLALFIANTWQDIFLSQSVISQAMQLVARHRAKGEVQNCLRAFLCWEKNAPVDVGIMVSKLLLTIQLCPKTEFQSSEKFGEDLSDSIWEYVFAIDLLCCHQKWVWTHDHVISKELWPVMDKWIKYRKGHVNITYTPDVIVASILRLIGRLGQLGLKEGFPTAVKNISSVIGMFIQHARDEDIPWGIQLAAVYALCDLSPSNPKEISKILEAWQRETSNTVPSAIISCLEEVGSLSVGDSDP